MGLGRTVVIITVVVALGGPAVSAQKLADELRRHQPFENLQILDKSIDAEELASTMREISHAIGSERGCLFCHVGESDTPLSTWDFASDEKVEKQIARQMLRMVRSMNEEYLRDLPGRNAPVTVTCRTCHATRPRPIPLDDLLLEVLRDEGLDAMIERYRKLRARYYGYGAYDLQEHVLRRLASRLREDETDERLAILALNLEFYPDSWRTLAARGHAYLHSGERELAEIAFLRSLEIHKSQDALEGLHLARSSTAELEDPSE